MPEDTGMVGAVGVGFGATPGLGLGFMLGAAGGDKPPSNLDEKPALFFDSC
jgi:hypothetical protein